MKAKISMPENKTEISLNVAGKSVKDVAMELGRLAWILHTMTKLSDECKNGFMYIDETGDSLFPIPQLNYREWEDDKYSFSGNNVISGYTRTDGKVSVHIDPHFMEWARTDKPIDEYCKERAKEILNGIQEQEANK